MSKYQELEREDAPKRKCFNGDNFNGEYKKTKREFVLLNYENNFFNTKLKDKVKHYFDKKQNGITWWGGIYPTGHVLSSQIACLNFLFELRSDKNAVLTIAKNIKEDLIDVLEIDCDKEGTRAYIAFEVVSYNDYLNENENGQKPTRGANCTSIDALILAKDKNEKTILIPIEWKYTEWYGNTDKSIEDGRGHEKGSQESGKTRLYRYSKLIKESEQLNIKLEDYKSSIYFFEPFYQLMRQTLWAEQMIKNKDNDQIKADDFIHVNVIPKENHDLLKNDLNTNKRRKPYTNGELKGSLEEVWKSCLKDTNKYKIIDPKALLSNIDKVVYKDLINYLAIRYK